MISVSGGPLVAEDPGVAVVVGADRSRNAESASTRPKIVIGCSIPGYSGYDSIRSKEVSARTRSTSNSGTNTAESPPTLSAYMIGRSFERKTKPVK